MPQFAMVYANWQLTLQLYHPKFRFHFKPVFEGDKVLSKGLPKKKKFSELR
jgi:hypothetical protein